MAVHHLPVIRLWLRAAQSQRRQRPLYRTVTFVDERVSHIYSIIHYSIVQYITLNSIILYYSLASRARPMVLTSMPCIAMKTSSTRGSSARQGLTSHANTYPRDMRASSINDTLTRNSVDMNRSKRFHDKKQQVISRTNPVRIAIVHMGI